MKYIITESRLHDFILKWMDETYSNLNKIDIPGAVWIYLTSESSPVFSYDKRNGLVRASFPEIGKYLHSLFNLNKDQMEEIIKVWLRTRHDFNPRFVDFYNY